MVSAKLTKVQDWLVAKKLTLNSNFVTLHPCQKKLDRDVIVKIYDIDSNEFVPLAQRTYVKYLGILIDLNLTWKYHVSYVTSK